MSPTRPWKLTLFGLWFANFVTAAGMLAMVPFLTFFVEDLGVGDRASVNLWTGWMVGAAPIAAALMGPVWGGIGDRVGRRAMVLRAMGAIVLFVGLMYLVTNPLQLLFLRLLQGTFSGFAAPSITLASVQAPSDRQAFVAGVMESARPAGAMLGYQLGGYLEDAGRMRDVFPICSALALLGVIVVMVLVREAPRSEESRAAARAESQLGMGARIAAVWRRALGDLLSVFRIPKLARFLSAVVVVRFLLSTYEPSFARYVHQLGGDSLEAGNLLAANSGLAVLCMPVWARLMDRGGSGPRRVFAKCALILAAGSCWMACAQTAAELWPGAILSAIALAGIMPAGYGMAVRESSEEHRGRTVGSVFLAMALAHALGAVASGKLLNVLGFEGLLVTMTMLTGTLGSLSLLASWRARRGAPEH